MNDTKWASGTYTEGQMVAEYKQQLRIWTVDGCGVETEVKTKRYWLQIFNVNGDIDVRIKQTF